jgi:hypothetical protein
MEKAFLNSETNKKFIFPIFQNNRKSLLLCCFRAMRKDNTTTTINSSIFGITVAILYIGIRNNE